MIDAMTHGHRNTTMTHPMKHATLTAALVLLAATAQAQTKPDGQWRGNGGAALSLASGNTDSRSLLVNADAVRATESDKISASAAVNYASGKVDGVDRTTANRWAAGAGYEFNITPQWFAFGKLGLEGDRLIDLSRRVSLAGGVGLHVLATPDNRFDVFGGVGHVTDRYRVAKTVGDKTDTTFARASVYLGEESAHKLSATTSFKQRLDLYPGISGDKALIARFSAGLAVAMSSTMSLTVGVTDSYNSKPPAGTKSNDLGLFTGINVKFGAL